MTNKAPRRLHRELPVLVISTGCPAGIGPEVSLRAAAQFEGLKVLVGEEKTLRAAAELVRISQSRLLPFTGEAQDPELLYFQATGPRLAAKDRKPGSPSPLAGQAQLEYVEEAYHLTKSGARRALVTAPVNKAAVVASNLRRARSFRGHTEWLQRLDSAKTSVMCFMGEPYATSLVTTHIPLRQVPRDISVEKVAEAAFQLAKLLLQLGKKKPQIAVAALNPHAGEGELLGHEESKVIRPGLRLAQTRLGSQGSFIGPIGAETAFRKAAQGGYDGVVAMYHDQATIPMKITNFGEAVNVTMGLSVVRTSVDHGTAYDIAWSGKADASGMQKALALGARLVPIPRDSRGRKR